MLNYSVLDGHLAVTPKNQQLNMLHTRRSTVTSLSKTTRNLNSHTDFAKGAGESFPYLEQEVGKN